MTIKQNGGIFGRNPTFNDVDVEGNLTTSGTITVAADSISGDAIDGGTATPTTVTSTIGNFTTLNNGGTIPADTHGSWSHSFFGGKGSIVSENNPAGGIPGLYLTDNAYLDVNTGSFSYLTTDEASAIRLTGGEIQFRSAASGTAGTTVALAEKAKFTTAGNLAFTSGLGIDFSATSDGGTVESELLNDYEDGYYTATLTPATSGTITLNSGYNKLAYTKVGRLVTVGGHLYVSSSSSPVGSTVDVNLPFTVAAPGTGAINRAAAWSGIAVTSDGAASVLHLTGANATTITLQVDASTIGGTYNFRFGFSYIAA
jgi:hypothetical protein